LAANPADKRIIESDWLGRKGPTLNQSELFVLALWLSIDAFASTMAEAIRTFEELERQGVDLSRYRT